MSITITEFCEKHGACLKGREWALENCQTMDEVWAKVNPEWLIWIATRPGVLTDRELRLFGVSSARRVQHLMRDPRSLAALDVAERHANGEATDEELSAAWSAAWSAAESAAWSAARSAAWSAARSAAESEADSAAWSAARSAAESAARSAAESAAWSAAESAAWSEQADWLRANTTPRWEVPA